MQKMKYNFKEKIIVLIHTLIVIIGASYIGIIICKLVYYLIKKITL